MPSPALKLRVSLAAGQMLNYYQRFDLNEKELTFFKDIFEANRGDFTVSYRKKIMAEFAKANRAHSARFRFRCRF